MSWCVAQSFPHSTTQIGLMYSLHQNHNLMMVQPAHGPHQWLAYPRDTQCHQQVQSVSFQAHRINWMGGWFTEGGLVTTKWSIYPKFGSVMFSSWIVYFMYILFWMKDVARGKIANVWLHYQCKVIRTQKATFNIWWNTLAIPILYFCCKCF